MPATSRLCGKSKTFLICHKTLKWVSYICTYLKKFSFISRLFFGILCLVRVWLFAFIIEDLTIISLKWHRIFFSARLHSQTPKQRPPPLLSLSSVVSHRHKRFNIIRALTATKTKSILVLKLNVECITCYSIKRPCSGTINWTNSWLYCKKSKNYQIYYNFVNNFPFGSKISSLRKIISSRPFVMSIFIHISAQWRHSAGNLCAVCRQADLCADATHERYKRHINRRNQMTISDTFDTSLLGCCMWMVIKRMGEVAF